MKLTEAMDKKELAAWEAAITPGQHAAVLANVTKRQHKELERLSTAIKAANEPRKISRRTKGDVMPKSYPGLRVLASSKGFGWPALCREAKEAITEVARLHHLEQAFAYLRDNDLGLRLRQLFDGECFAIAHRPGHRPEGRVSGSTPAEAIIRLAANVAESTGAAEAKGS